jgi:hypothetical protein
MDGLVARYTNYNYSADGFESVNAEKGFPISADFSRPLLYYFEVTFTPIDVHWLSM